MSSSTKQIVHLAATTKDKRIAVTNNFDLPAICIVCDTAIENLDGENVSCCCVMFDNSKQSSAMIFRQKGDCRQTIKFLQHYHFINSFFV